MNNKLLNCSISVSCFSITLLFLVTSCVTNRKTTYLQGGDAAADSTVTVTDPAYRVQPTDNLFVRVITPEPKWASMFNLMSENVTSIASSEQSANLISYPVLASGNIRMPFIGEIPVAGKTLPEISATIEAALADFITDFDVTVSLVNNYVSLLGDVSNPGRYPIYKEQMNIFQALAMAGDMGDYSDRHRVQVIRRTPGGTVVREFDLTRRSIIDSEFFYVMPNDVIYARPMKGKFFKMNAFPFSVVLSTITTFLLILNYVR